MSNELNGDTLASPFYRVSAKALIFDNARQLLVVQNNLGEWEMPGGGLEREESVADCLRRELREEAGVDVTVGGFRFFFRSPSSKWKYVALRMVFDAQLTKPQPLVTGADMQSARFVSREEFLRLPFAESEAEIQQYVSDIWLTS